MFLGAFNLPERYSYLTHQFHKQITLYSPQRPRQCVPSAHLHQPPCMPGTKSKSGISYHVMLYLTFWFILNSNLKNFFFRKLLVWPHILVLLRKSNSYHLSVEELPISLSLTSILSIHFRNWSIILIVFKANWKMYWEKLTFYWYVTVSGLLRMSVPNLHRYQVVSVFSVFLFKFFIVI